LEQNLRECGFTEAKNRNVTTFDLDCNHLKITLNAYGVTFVTTSAFFRLKLSKAVFFGDGVGYGF
jgi:hypothetical protein